jgi:Protein of unknown function (DUF2992).
MNIKLTVLFEEPFWIGLFERTCDGMYEVSKVTFGQEPKDYEVFDFLLKNYNRIRFSKPIIQEKTEEKRVNPKRLQRKIRDEMQNNGMGTRAQMAVKLDLETKKAETIKQTREEKEEAKRLEFEMKQEKKKEKKKGH